MIYTLSAKTMSVLSDESFQKLRKFGQTENLGQRKLRRRKTYSRLKSTAILFLDRILSSIQR